MYMTRSDSWSLGRRVEALFNMVGGISTVVDLPDVRDICEGSMEAVTSLRVFQQAQCIPRQVELHDGADGRSLRHSAVKSVLGREDG